MAAFVKVDQGGNVVGATELPELDDAEVSMPDDGDGAQYYPVENLEFLMDRPSLTAKLKWNDGFPLWVETVTFDELSAAAIIRIDAAAEALRLAVVNRMTMQTEEYRRVEAQARAWRAAGYPEDDEAGAPRGVAGWAMAKWRNGWTNRQACDDILATADGWMQILDTLRDLRLSNKEDVRHASDSLEIRAIVGDMENDMRALAQQLNLTLTE